MRDSIKIAHKFVSMLDENAECSLAFFKICGGWDALGGLTIKKTFRLL